MTLSTERLLSFLEDKLKSKDGGQEGQVPDFGLGDAAGRERHQSVAVDPQQAFILCVDLAL